MLILNDEEQADHAKLHEVYACESLVDGSRIQNTTSVVFKANDIYHGVSLGNPKQTERDNIEDRDQWRNDTVNDPDAGKIGIHGKERSPCN